MSLDTSYLDEDLSYNQRRQEHYEFQRGIVKLEQGNLEEGTTNPQ